MFNFFEPLQKCFQDKVGGGCGWEEIEPFVNGILKNLIVIGLFVAVCMVSYAGFVLFQGFGDAGARSKARHIFMSVIIGLVILFGAYFIVDIILTNLLVKPFKEGGVDF